MTKAKKYLWKKHKKVRLTCSECGVRYRKDTVHTCKKIKFCEHCTLPWRAHHKRLCPYFQMMKKINKEKNEKKKKKKYRSCATRYVLLDQVGYLGELRIELAEDNASPNQLLECEEKERVLGDGTETIIPFEEDGKPRYLPAGKDYHGFCIPDPGIPRPYDVPSDFFANVVAPGRSVEKKDYCYVTLKITDAHATKIGLNVTLIIEAERSEDLPNAKAGDIIRVHRALLVQHEDKKVVIFMRQPVASWVLFDAEGDGKGRSGKYTWDSLDVQMLECYKLFGKTLDLNVEMFDCIPEKYVNINDNLYAPKGKLYQWSLPPELAADIDTVADLNLLDNLNNQY